MVGQRPPAAISVGSSVAASTLDLQPAIRSKTPSTHASPVQAQQNDNCRRDPWTKRGISDSHPRISLATAIGTRARTGDSQRTRSAPPSQLRPDPDLALPATSGVAGEQTNLQPQARPDQARTGPFGSVSDTLQGFRLGWASRRRQSPRHRPRQTHTPPPFSPIDSSLNFLSLLFCFPSHPIPPPTLAHTIFMQARKKKKPKKKTTTSITLPGQEPRDPLEP